MPDEDNSYLKAALEMDAVTAVSVLGFTVGVAEILAEKAETTGELNLHEIVMVGLGIGLKLAREDIEISERFDSFITHYSREKLEYDLNKVTEDIRTTWKLGDLTYDK